MPWAIIFSTVKRSSAERTIHVLRMLVDACVFEATEAVVRGCGGIRQFCVCQCAVGKTSAGFVTCFQMRGIFHLSGPILKMFTMVWASLLHATIPRKRASSICQT